MEEFSLKLVSQIPKALRSAYLDSLSEPQEYFLEQLVQAGRAFTLVDPGQELKGYLITYETSIVELFLNTPTLNFYECVIARATSEMNIKTILIKSFDPLYTYVNRSVFQDHAIEGLLFRKYTNFAFRVDETIQIDTLKEVDLADVIAINDDFFESEEEIVGYITRNSAYAYRNLVGKFLGCGIVTRVIDGGNAVDLGVLVSPQVRKRGIGTYIVSHLKHICLERGDRPIAGCGVENIGSKKALEAAGFVSEHQLHRFSLYSFEFRD